MQVAAQATALFFTRQDQLLARALQIRSETYRVNRDSHLRSKIFQQA